MRKKINLNDYIGKKVSSFGAPDSKLILINQDGENKDKWLCQCECGNSISVKRSDLIRKDTKGTRSCGCMHKEVSYRFSQIHTHNLTNQQFGKLTAIKKSNKIDPDGNTYWWCQCECGNIVEVKTVNLIGDKTHSCGCITSYSEYKVKKLLIKYNIPFQKEFTFSDCLGMKGKRLRFDFAIFIDGKIKLIELQGDQHFNKNNYWNSEWLMQHDQKKKDYCKQNNIPLLEVLTTEDYLTKIKKFAEIQED